MIFGTDPPWVDSRSQMWAITRRFSSSSVDPPLRCCRTIREGPGEQLQASEPNSKSWAHTARAVDIGPRVGPKRGEGTWKAPDFGTRVLILNLISGAGNGARTRDLNFGNSQTTLHKCP
jgi:hypothetical protein